MMSNTEFLKGIHVEKQEQIIAAVNQQFAQEIAFLQQLVRAKSANPFPPGSAPADVPVEQEVAHIIAQELDHLGFSPQLTGVSPQRPNVVCHIPGAVADSRTLILNTHMDTVETTGYTRDPWGAQLLDGRLYGMGVADAKAQIAAFIYALLALRSANIRLAGNVTLAFVVDEETGACSPYGTRYLLEQGIIDGDAAIVGEPGDESIAIAHRGLYRFRLRTLGEATHTGLSAWEQGTHGHNAILDMARATLALADLTLPAVSTPAFPHNRSVFTFPTLISGGSGINVVPALCEAYGDVRLLPGITGETVSNLIHQRLQQHGITPEHYQLEELLFVPAAETAEHTAIVQLLAEAAQQITGTRPPLEGCGPACDGWMFITRGIPAICGYGAACGGVHGADEWIDLESLRQLTSIYAHTIMAYCQPAQ